MNDINEQQIIKMYCDDKCSQQNIATKLNVCQMTVCNILKKHKIHCRTTRKYKLNEEFFADLTSEKFLYFIGFFIADGYHYESENKLSFSINIKDREIMDNFNEWIYYGKHPIRIYDYSPTKCDPIVRLDIFSPPISVKLKKWGITQNKSFTSKLPNFNISNINFHHFLRGLFDGDGCICNSSTQNSFTIYLLGSETISKQIKNRLQLLGFSFREKIHITPNGKMIYLILGNNAEVKRFMDWMYKDATTYLHRKFDKYKELCKLF